MKALNIAIFSLFLTLLLSSCINTIHEEITLKPASSVVLRLYDSTDNQIYELGTPFKVNITSDPTTLVCVDFSDLLYGVNVSCGTTDSLGNYVINISVKSVSLNTFSDGAYAKVLSNGQVAYFTLSNHNDYQNLSIAISGTGVSNSTIDMNNDGIIDLRLPGALLSDRLEQNNFTDDNIVDIPNLNSAVLKYIEIPNSISFTDDLFLRFTPQIYYFQYTEDFSTNEFEETSSGALREGIWNTTSQTAHMMINYYAQNEYIGNVYSINNAGGPAPITKLNESHAYDNLNSTFLYAKYTRTITCGSELRTNRYDRWNTYNVTENSTIDLRYYWKASKTSTTTSSKITAAIGVYNFDTSTYDSIVGATVSGASTSSQSSDPQITSFFVDPKYINDTNGDGIGDVTFYLNWDMTCLSATPETYTTEYKIYDGWELGQEFDGYAPSIDNPQTVQTTSLYTPDTTIESIRINITIDDTSSKNATIYLTADGSSWEEIKGHNRIINHTFSTTGIDLRLKVDIWTDLPYTSPQISIIDFPDIIGTTYPSNIVVDLGNDGDADYTNNSLTTNPVDINLTSQSFDITNFKINNCVGVDNCLLPILFFSSTRGTMNFTYINYTANGLTDILIDTSTVNVTSISQNVPINVSLGSINISGIKYVYNGQNNITVTAHDSASIVTDSSVVQVYFSNFSITMPDGIDWLEFIPRTSFSKNVSAYGQSDKISIFNFTGLNYAKNMNLTFLMNSSSSCVNLSYSFTPNITDATLITSDQWIPIYTNQAYGYEEQIWLFADYGCSYSQWGYFEPIFSFRGCAVGSICNGDR